MTQAFNLSQLANNLNTSGQLDATDGLTGVVPDANLPTISASKGGTGQTSLTANNVLLGNGTSAVQFVAPSTSGNILTSNGTTWVSSTPASSAPTTAQVLSATAGATALVVGTYAILGNVTAGVARTNNVNVAGSSLYNMFYISATSGGVWDNGAGATQTGTWKYLGASFDTSFSTGAGGLYLRVA